MINYRCADESDYSRINDLYNRLYQKNRTLKQFYWEFHEAPAGKSIYIIAEDGDKVIGTQCAIPIFLLMDTGELILSGKSEDTLVDPTYRGKNIFNEMYQLLFDECTKNGIKVIWGFTSARKPFRKLGFDIPYDHSQVVLVNYIIPAYHYLVSLNEKNKTAEKIKIFGLSLLSRLKKGITPGCSISKEYDMIQEPVTDMRSLLEANLKHFKHSFSIEQTSEYQKWRIYQDPNYLKVLSFSLRDKERNLKGCFLANLTSQGVGYIIQCLFDPQTNFSTRKGFVQACSKIILQEGCHVIRNWTFAHNIFGLDEIRLFKASGYFFMNRGVGLVWKKLEDVPLDVNNFLLSRIATQGIL